MVITIFVRHSAGCRYAGDEFHKACRCPKHLRWSHGGKQFRKAAGTRSWEEAEKGKRRLESQLSGEPLPGSARVQQTIARAIKVFTADKKNQGLTPSVLGKYDRELARFNAFCESRSVFVVAAVTLELLSDFRSDWPTLYPSTITRVRVQSRLRTFLRFCYEAKWLDRVPKMSTIKEDEAPTLPLTAAEYDRLLKTIPKTFPDSAKAARVKALVQTMRWSGVGIRDAVTLERAELIHDKKRGLYRIVTSRQKTGTHVSVPIPPKVAKEVLAVNGSRYFFWTGNGKEVSAVTNWQHDLRALFKDAGITAAGNMLSHRLRDTFACELLQRGVPLEEVSKLLGHESIKTTERHYSKWIKSRQDRLDSLVMGTW